uniref:TIL domain-containing protein n=1 Tax=Anopheles christyi TaxID=43041 RepID=A0A182JUW7_9DIPT
MKMTFDRVCIFLLVLIALASKMSTAVKQCDPIYEEYTDKADCDENCQNICTPMEDFCACRYVLTNVTPSEQQEQCAQLSVQMHGGSTTKRSGLAGIVANTP